MKWLQKNLFNTIIALVSLFMFFSSFEFNEKARLAPILVSGAIFFMILLQLIHDTFPKLARVLPFSNQIGIFNHSANNKHSDDPEEENRNWKFILFLFLFLIMFAILMYLTSYLLAIPIFLCLFIWLVGNERFVSALSIAIGMTGFMYVLFELILNSSL